MCRKISFLVSFVLVLCLVGNSFGVVANMDIGAVGIPGGAVETAGVWTIEGSGNDIWGDYDQFHYVFRPLEGNGELEVNLVSFTKPNYWAKVGVMVRETLADNSKEVSIVLTGGGDHKVQMPYRNTTGGGTGSPIEINGLPAPRMLKIARNGNIITGSYWFVAIPGFLEYYVDTDLDVPMNPDVYIGMVVCSHNNGALSTAVFDSVTWPPMAYPRPWALLPLDGTSGIPVDAPPTLSWMPGDGAVSSDVHFGTDPDPLSQPPVANKLLGNETYTPDAPLLGGVIYYWQIVSQPGDVEGPVMTFKTERPGTGTIAMEIWGGIGGTNVGDLTGNPRYPASPDWTGEISVFDTTDNPGSKIPTNIWDNYGGRIRGRLCPELSGDYTFWIASDDSSELWLSTTGKTCEATVVAHVAGWCGWHDYDGDNGGKANKISDPIYLEGGKEYPIWALWKEGGGGDHCAVAWEGPDSPSRTEIDGYFLKPANVDDTASNPSIPNGDTVTPLEAETLSFTPAVGATAHEVLFGEAGSMALIATLPPEETSVAISVEAGKSYEWQVNELFNGDVAEGCLWSFSVEEWVSKDIGRAGAEPAGSSSYDADTGVFTINAGGSELWGQNDQFHYVYTTMEMTRAKGEVQARVLSIQQPDSWRRAGVMIRETTAPNARKFMAHKTGHNNTRMQRRENPGQDTWNGPDNWNLDPGFPMFVKVTRDRYRFDAYRSWDGEEWFHMGGATMGMDVDKYVCVGLAVCHHPGLPQDQLTTATIDSLSITTPDPRMACCPNPANGDDGADINAHPSWTAGDGAASHRVYFGPDAEAVAARTELLFELPGDVTSFDPIDSDRQSFLFNETFHWVVDTVMADGTVIPGELWTFTVQDYRTVDDFESYTEEIPEQHVQLGKIIVAAVPPPDQTEIPGGIIPGYTVEAVEPDTGCLVAHYEFENNADDSTANANNGTVYGDPAYVAGPVSLAIECDATDDHNDYIVVPDSASLSFGTDSFSVGFWIKSGWTGGDKEFIVKNGSAGSEFGGKPPTGPNSGKRYVLKFDGEFRFAVDDDSVKTICKTDESNIATGDWVHVTAIRNRADDKMYIYADGVLVGEQDDATETSIDSPGEIMTIAAAQKENGTYAGEIGHWFTGGLDDMRFYNCALSHGNARYLAGVGDLVVPDIILPSTYVPMMAHYKLDGDATDSSGNGNDGVEQGGPTYVEGYVDQAISLDTSQDVKISDFGEIDAVTELSIAMWVKTNNLGRRQFMWFTDESCGYSKVRCYMRNSQWRFRHGNGTSNIEIRVDADPSAEGEWTHYLAMRRNGDKLYLYINGVLEGTADYTGPGCLQPNSWIGSEKGSRKFDGCIDDVRVYNYVLSEGEARYLADVGHKRAPDFLGPLLLHYEFEGNLDDSSGNEFHGTAHGGVFIHDDPEMGSVLGLPGGSNQYVSAPKVGNLGNDPVSIACWARATSTNIPDWSLVFGFTGTEGGGGGCGSHFNIGSIGGPGGMGAHIWCWERTIFTDQEALDWRHYAMTFDGSTIAYYGDGALIGTQAYDLWRRYDRIHVGSRVTQDSSFIGRVDDARVYNIPLTQNQLRTIINEVPNPFDETWSGRGAASPSLDAEFANEGGQSMRVEYTGNGVVSRLDPFGDGAHPHGQNGDWTLGDAKAVALHFRGDPGNAPGQMFIQLKTAVPSENIIRVPYKGDPEDLMSPFWSEWNIPIHDLRTGKPSDPIPDEGLPATKIQEVGVGVLGGGSGILNFDDIRIYPTRCVPALGPEYDLTGDCLVDRLDLYAVIGEWLAMEPPEDDWDRVAYFDDRYPSGWADIEVAAYLRDYVSTVGYTILNADELKTWMDARIADEALSVVIMCQDIAPDTVVETIDASCTLRKYLDAGGKIVHYADIPFYNVGHADGSRTTHATDGSIGVLGFNAAGAAWNSGNLISITPAGIDWGLLFIHQSNRGALAGDVDVVLATDDDGDAAAWVKHYSSNRSGGFVRIFDSDIAPDPFYFPVVADIVNVAEHKHYPVGDLYDDGIVNFFDYADVMNHFGEEKLYP